MGDRGGDLESFLGGGRRGLVLRTGALASGFVVALVDLDWRKVLRVVCAHFVRAGHGIACRLYIAESLTCILPKGRTSFCLGFT